MGDARLADPWLAAEWFVSPDSERRRQGLAVLAAAGDLLSSPLVLHLLASRLDESDLDLRRQIVAALAGCFQPDASKEARNYLAGLLAGFGRTHVEWLLEAVAGSDQGPAPAEARPSVVALLDRVPNLAGTLTRVASDRAVALPTRAAAVAALGELGVIEALPALEGLKTRIEGQSAGQLAMAFAPGSGPAEDELIGALKAAIALLLENE